MQKLLIVAVFLVAVPVCLWLMQSNASAVPDDSEGRTIADLFIQQIQAGQASAAWDSTTAEFKSAEGREAFLRFVGSEKKTIQTSVFESSRTVEQHGVQYTEYSFKSEAGKHVVLTLGSEGQQWHVTAMRIE